MNRESNLLRAEIDSLTAENIALRAEIAELKSELSAIKAGLDEKIQAAVLRAWGEILKAQPPRESQTEGAGSISDEQRSE